ncbi:MAG: hypothetical protein PVG99_13470 [Desulfobacteraceae bacterium]|jgi:hypothetical protein
MDRFSKRDVKEILELLENELDSIPRLDKLQKMKMRSKIRRQENWLAGLAHPKPPKIVMHLGERLSDFFYQYPSGFSDRLTELLETKIAKMEKEKAYASKSTQ